MHIPEGFLGPATYGTAYAVALPCWWWGARRVRRVLATAVVPRVAVVAAAAFTLMQLMIPLPGGTTVHPTGLGLIVLVADGWLTYLSLSLVLLLQALLLGEGGLTTLPVNALALGLAGGMTARAVWRLLRRRPRLAALLAGWAGVTVAALVVAVVLGAQPHLARDAGGTPLYFPFGWRVTLPAVVLPHLVVGLLDGLLAAAAVGILAPEAER